MFFFRKCIVLLSYTVELNHRHVHFLTICKSLGADARKCIYKHAKLCINQIYKYNIQFSTKVNEFLMWSDRVR